MPMATTDPKDVPLYERVVTWDMANVPGGYPQLSGYDAREPGTVALTSLPLVALGFVFGGSGEGSGGVGDAEYLKQLARSPEALIQGAITGDPVTEAQVMWPKGIAGTLKILERDPSGAVNSYSITYGAPTVIRTYTQPAITRNANGAATFIPAIVVSGEVEQDFPTFGSRISGGNATSTPTNILSGGSATSVPAYTIRGGGSGGEALQFASVLSGGDATSTPTNILRGGESTVAPQYQINGGGA
jgi:hypothetical protein